MSFVFGKYEKIRRLAQGGMGDVFLARQTGVLDRLAILKRLRGDLASETDFVEQFLDEARVAAKLNHPNIVAIYDVGEWNGHYYIAMEYVPGEDLSKLWYAAAKAVVGLPFQVSVRIIYEAALGLDHAHLARDMRGNPLNIVHRDISPQNIMVRGDGVVKLVDFGIAKASNRSSTTKVGMVKGKLQYMSPEQVRGEALDGRSDQFSLGVVLWEMCTGRRLFKAESENGTLTKILQAPIPKPSAHVPGFPSELETTILRMLEREADKRFRTVGEAAQGLKAYLDRSALQGGDTSVATFVQQVLGKELEDRVADLTPMEPSAPREYPQPRTPPEQAAKARPTLHDRPPRTIETPETVGTEEAEVITDDAPTRIVGEERVEKPRRVPAGPWNIKRAVGGTPLRFEELAALEHAIECGEIDADDLIADENKAWIKLKDVPRFALLFAKTVVADTLDAPQSVTSEIPSDERQVVRAPPAPDAAQTPGLGPHESTETVDGGAAAGFSLGSLPQAQTGTWGAPEIARALEAPLGVTLPAALPAEGDRAGSARGAWIPTAAWGLGGVVGSLAVVAALMAAFAPDTFDRLLRPSTTSSEIVMALQASREDDERSIAALLKAKEQALGGDAVTSDVLAATAILHLAHARQAEQRAALALLASRLGVSTTTKDGSGSTPDAARARAYKLATQAAAREDQTPGALLALALYQAESGARVEFDTDAARVTEAVRGDPHADVMKRELQIARVLLGARLALQGSERRIIAEAMRELAKHDDVRVMRMVPVLRAHGAAMLPGDARQGEVELLRAEVARIKVEGNDARTRALDVILAALKSTDSTFKPENTGMMLAPAPLSSSSSTSPSAPPSVPPSVPPSPSSSALPPPTSGTSPVVMPLASSTGSPASPGPPAASESPTMAGTTTAKPVVAETSTFDGAMERAERARRAGRNREALKEAAKALTYREDAVPAHRIAGLASAATKQWEAADRHLRVVLAANAKDCEALFGLAEAIHGQGKTEEARVAYQGYIDICPVGPRVDDARAAVVRLE